MSQDKREDAAKKRVREATEPIKRSDAPGRNRRSQRIQGDSETCSRICGVTWRTTRIQKKDKRGFCPRDELEDNHIMSSHVHIGMYNALKELGASEESARAAVADLPIPQHLATKEDLLKAIVEVKVEMASLRGDVMRELGIIKWAYVAYGPIIIGLLVKLVFFP